MSSATDPNLAACE